MELAGPILDLPPWAIFINHRSKLRRPLNELGFKPKGVYPWHSCLKKSAEVNAHAALVQFVKHLPWCVNLNLAFRLTDQSKLKTGHVDFVEIVIRSRRSHSRLRAVMAAMSCSSLMVV